MWEVVVKCTECELTATSMPHAAEHAAIDEAMESLINMHELIGSSHIPDKYKGRLNKNLVLKDKYTMEDFESVVLAYVQRGELRIIKPEFQVLPPFCVFHGILSNGETRWYCRGWVKMDRPKYVECKRYDNGGSTSVGVANEHSNE